MLRHCVVVLCAVSFVIAVGSASANSFIDLSALDSYTTGNPCGVNSSGEVTGLFPVASPSHVYLYSGGTAGTMTDLTSKFISSGGLISSAIDGNGQMAVNQSIKGWSYSGGTNGTVVQLTGSKTQISATCIDANGDIGGDCLSGSVRAPMVYTGGTAYYLNPPYANVASTIFSINSNGQACGFNKYAPPLNPAGMWATVWTYTISGGSLTSQSATDISSYLSAAFSGYEASQAYSVNDLGQVVGDWSTTYGANQGQMTGAFLYNMSTNAVTSLPLMFTTQIGLGYLFNGAGESQLINDSSQVVGQTTVGGVPHAAIWSATSGLQDLNTLYAGILPTGFVLNNATAIDNNGDVAGYGTDSSGHTTQAFLILNQATPEPSTLLLAVAGMAGLLACAWRRKGK